MFEAVIFDMDGLMFDTERLAKEAWRTVGEQLGLVIGEEVVSRIRGATPTQSAEIFREVYGEAFDYPAAKAMRNAWVEDEIARNGVPVKPGLAELLCKLRRAGVRTAVASSSPHATVAKYLRMAGFADDFDAVLGAEDFARSKPAPDSFLAAARALGADPARCLVLEDSANGLHAAHCAGMTAVCIPDLALPDADALGKAAAVLPSLGEVFDRMMNR